MIMMNLTPTISSVPNYPLLNPWGAGQLMVFSGLDGTTDYSQGLLIRTGCERGVLRVEHPQRVTVKLAGDPAAPTGLTSDVLVFGSSRAVIVDAHHILIDGTSEIIDTLPDGLKTLNRNGRTLLGVASHFRSELVDTDIDALIHERLTWLNARVKEQPRRPAELKALSMMKSQVCSAEGRIQHRWTTPDRWPHRDLWLWDSAFHAIGWRHLDPSIARDAIEAVFDGQAESGFIPHAASPRSCSEITQPPVLAWAVQLVDETAPDCDWLARVYVPLTRYVEWDLAHRDIDGNGLCEWHINPELNNRSDESGMDNSTRFDSGGALDAVDFNSYLARECECLADFAARLGRTEEAALWTCRHKALCEAIRRELWDEEKGFFFDRDITTGVHTGIWASVGFLPLICGAATPTQAERIIAHLRPGGKFATPVSIPSIALDDPGCTHDMWRGPVWINLNWMIAHGLERYGHLDQAKTLRATTMAEIERWHATLGTIFEYYDSRGEVPPDQLPRKGRLDPSNFYHQTFHDYGWSATLYVDLLATTC
jgi:hypothetical protein